MPDGKGLGGEEDAKKHSRPQNWYVAGFDEEGKSSTSYSDRGGPCYVVQKKTMEQDGYTALQVGLRGAQEKLALRTL